MENMATGKMTTRASEYRTAGYCLMNERALLKNSNINYIFLMIPRRQQTKMRQPLRKDQPLARDEFRRLTNPIISKETQTARTMVKKV